MLVIFLRSAEHCRSTLLISLIFVSRFHFPIVSRVKQPLEQILGRSIDELKSTSPQGSSSPGTPAAPIDRAAAKRAELRRAEQERRRKEAVNIKL